MKTAFAFVLLISSVAGLQAASKADAEVLAVVDTWKQAMVKGDAATLGKLYHADLTYEHSSGKTEMKAEAIENATKAGSVAKAIELNHSTVRVYGNTALVKTTGAFTTAAGVVNNLDILMVFLKGAQGWQLVARQSTKLP